MARGPNPPDRPSGSISDSRTTPAGGCRAAAGGGDDAFVPGHSAAAPTDRAPLERTCGKGELTGFGRPSCRCRTCSRAGQQAWLLSLIVAAFSFPFTFGHAVAGHQRRVSLATAGACDRHVHFTGNPPLRHGGRTGGIYHCTRAFYCVERGRGRGRGHEPAEHQLSLKISEKSTPTAAKKSGYTAEIVKSEPTAAEKSDPTAGCSSKASAAPTAAEAVTPAATTTARSAAAGRVRILKASTTSTQRQQQQ